MTPLISARLKNLALHLARTPLHPQWLALRLKRTQTLWVRTNARGRVLDVGCADSGTSNFLELGQVSDYVSIDLPKTGAERYGSQPTAWATAEALPFCDSSWDTVLMLDVLEHVPAAGRALSEAARVLAPSGVLLLSVPFAYPVHDEPFDFRRWTTHGLHEELRSAGLKATESIALGSAVEAGCCSTSIGIARATLNALRKNKIWLSAVPIALIAITLTNCWGWLLSLLCKDRAFMPIRIHLVARLA